MLAHVMTALSDERIAQRLMRRVDEREGLLWQLGKRYARSQPGDAGAVADSDAEACRLEEGLGMAVPSRSAEGDWVERVLTGLLNDRQPGDPPEAVLVAGPPGAGKGVVTEAVCHYFRHAGCVVVDRNELLYLHPAYASRVRPDDRVDLSDLRAEVAAVAERLIEGALAARLNLVLDDRDFCGTAGAELLRRLNDAGYPTAVLALAVDPEGAWETARQRYQAQRAERGAGRWLDRTAFDDAYRRLGEFLTAAEGPGGADEVYLLTVLGECIAAQTRPTPAAAFQELLASEAWAACVPASVPASTTGPVPGANLSPAVPAVSAPLADAPPSGFRIRVNATRCPPS